MFTDYSCAVLLAHSEFVVVSKLLCQTKSIDGLQAVEDYIGKGDTEQFQIYIKREGLLLLDAASWNRSEFIMLDEFPTKTVCFLVLKIFNNNINIIYCY